jgi:sigma-E factor negative regulatory protein RseC
MATEQGIVISIVTAEPGTARVKTIPPSACKACSSRGSCSSGGGKEREVDVINTVGAKDGDLIQISIETGALLKATFLLYVFPILIMIIGGTIGNFLGQRLSLNPSFMSAGTAIGTFILAMAFVRSQAGKMALNLRYRPKITRIISRGKTHHPAPSVMDNCSSQTPNNMRSRIE